MTKEEPLGYVAEPQKQVPIAYDVDVAVVGGGLAGIFSAIAAGVWERKPCSSTASPPWAATSVRR